MTIVTTGAKMIYNLAVAHISSLPSLQWQACDIGRAVNIQLGDLQKFWKEEILQGAKLLADKYGNYAGGYNIWSICMMNNMGWRIVSYTACPPGKYLDPVTRTCQTEYVPPEDIPPPPPPEPKKDYTIIIAAGIVALALFMRR